MAREVNPIETRDEYGNDIDPEEDDREEGEIVSDDNDCEGYVAFDISKCGSEPGKGHQNCAQEQGWGNNGQNKFFVGSVQKKKRGHRGKKKGGRNSGAGNNRFCLGRCS